MKAITIWQPWATLIADGRKRYETRSWDTDYRGLLAIHSAKRWQSDQQDIVAELIDAFPAVFGEYTDYDWPFGEVLSICRLIDVHRARDILPTLSDEERSVGDYSDGRYAWQLEPVLSLSPALAERGQQKLWEWVPPSDLFTGHVAIVGSRSLAGDQVAIAGIREAVNALPKGSTVVSGNARGVDQIAEAAAPRGVQYVR